MCAFGIFGQIVAVAVIVTTSRIKITKLMLRKCLKNLHN